MNDPGDRIVKVPLPISAIRAMDELIAAGLGGFETRAELINEAVGNLINELAYPEASPEALRSPRRADVHSSATRPDIAQPERDELTLLSIDATSLLLTDSVHRIDAGIAEVTRGLLLGLHNRDYASLWALNRLARYSRSGPIGFSEYLSRVTAAAWYYGEQLQSLQEEGQPKLALLFPTNSSKQPSAERAFQGFAIGSASIQHNRVRAQGPLFLWDAIQIESLSGLTVGLTDNGARLLERLGGLSLALPHDASHARAFFEHLSEHAPEDLAGFEMVLQAIQAEPDRTALLEAVHTGEPAWSDATASSVVQGYVARAREWGLLEPKLWQGRYRITPRGKDLMPLVAANKKGEGL